MVNFNLGFLLFKLLVVHEWLRSNYFSLRTRKHSQVVCHCKELAVCWCKRENRNPYNSLAAARCHCGLGNFETAVRVDCSLDCHISGISCYLLVGLPLGKRRVQLYHCYHCWCLFTFLSSLFMVVFPTVCINHLLCPQEQIHLIFDFSVGGAVEGVQRWKC